MKEEAKESLCVSRLCCLLEEEKSACARHSRKDCCFPVVVLHGHHLKKKSWNDTHDSFKSLNFHHLIASRTTWDARIVFPLSFFPSLFVTTSPTERYNRTSRRRSNTKSRLPTDRRLSIVDCRLPISYHSYIRINTTVQSTEKTARVGEQRPRLVISFFAITGISFSFQACIFLRLVDSSSTFCTFVFPSGLPWCQVCPGPLPSIMSIATTSATKP